MLPPGAPSAAPSITGAPPLSASGTEFFSRLETLRGIAALQVAAMHAWQSTWLDGAGKKHRFVELSDPHWYRDWDSLLLRILGNGQGAVLLFFVISGFVLTGSLLRGPERKGEAWTSFLIARLCRIYPAVFATVGIFALVYWTTGAFLDSPAAYTWKQLVLNALLISALINGVMWSLQVELLAVPLLFLAYLGWRRFGLSVPIGMMAALVVVLVKPSWRWSVTGVDLSIIFAFPLGMIAFLASRSWIEQRSSRFIGVVILTAVAGFLAARPLLGWSRPGTVSEMLCCAAMVACLAFGRSDIVGRIFDWAPLRFFGRISYSFYLLHPLTLIVIWKIPLTLGAIIQAGVPRIVVAMVLFVLSTMAITPLALAVYRWVEMPGVSAGRRLKRALSRRRSHPPGAEPARQRVVIGGSSP